MRLISSWPREGLEVLGGRELEEMESRRSSTEDLERSGWSSLARPREGGLFRWASREEKRDVREVGAVGDLPFRSRLLSKREAMSSSIDCARPEGGLSCRWWCVVVKARDFWHWARPLQCLAIGAVARVVDNLYAAGARNGSKGCDERSNASLALNSSIATKE